MVPLVLGDGASYGKANPRTGHLTKRHRLVCLLHAINDYVCLLVRSIQPSHPGVLASIFTIFCTARNVKGIRMTPNKK